MMAAHKNAVVIANIRNLLKKYLRKMTGEVSKGYLARVNQEKGVESAEIILQVNQINPLGNRKYGLIIHDCQNEMKALLNSSMSGLVRGESLIDGTITIVPSAASILCTIQRCETSMSNLPQKSRLVYPFLKRHLYHIHQENDRILGSWGRQSLCNSALSILISNKFSSKISF